MKGHKKAPGAFGRGRFFELGIFRGLGGSYFRVAR